jgi:hypothetical protein
VAGHDARGRFGEAGEAVSLIERIIDAAARRTVADHEKRIAALERFVREVEEERRNQEALKALAKKLMGSK